MSSDKNRSVDPRVRLAIAQWPDDAPRGAVTTFCAEHSISRKTFYVLRRRARLEGPAAVLEPRSRRPRSSPARLPEAVRSQALEVRAALERSGLDHGPISVHDKMASMGLKAPSPAWLARLFRDQGVARSEPSKRPRAAWRRFVYPAPNACWQHRRHRVRHHPRTQGGHLPAPGRPLPPGGGLPGRLQRDQSGRHRRLRQRRSRPGCAPAATWPTTASLSTPAGAESPDAWWSTCAPWGSSPLPPSPTTPPPRARTSVSTRPCSATWTSSPGRLHRRASGAGRPFRPRLQHPAPPPGPARAHHPAAGLGRH